MFLTFSACAYTFKLMEVKSQCFFKHLNYVLVVTMLNDYRSNKLLMNDIFHFEVIFEVFYKKNVILHSIDYLFV